MKGASSEGDSGKVSLLDDEILRCCLLVDLGEGVGAVA